VTKQDGTLLRVSQDVIERIRAQTDIVDLVAQYLELRRSGDNYRALCPFHNEKTPSFNVNQTRQIFHCFGCGRGGDAFKFLMLHDGLSFPEAIRVLARRAGIQLEAESPEAVERRSQRVRLTELNGCAAGYFRRQLLDQSDSGPREYLVRRSISAEVSDQFMLGYAPDSWTHCTAEMARSGFSRHELERSGLAKRRQSDDTLYELFRNRLIFPIHNISGNVVGFGGRTLGDDEPKYINSPETDVYRKGETLYGLYQARDAIRHKRVVLIVEGYMDLLLVVQAGFANVVATLGTALTERQAGLVRRFADSAVLVYDGDDAGCKAAERGVTVLVQMGIEPRVVLLPEGKDPDDYIRSHGREEFGALLDGAADMLDFVLRDAADAAALSPSEKSAVARRAFTVIEAIGDAIKQSDYLHLLAERLKVDETGVRREFASHRRPPGRARSGNGAGARIWPAVTYDLFGALVRNPEYVDKARREVDIEMMDDGPEKEVLGVLFEADPEAFHPELLLDRVQGDDARTLLSHVLVDSNSGSEEEHAAVFEGWLHKVRMDVLRKQMARIGQQIGEAERNGDQPRVNELLRQHNQSDRLLRSLQVKAEDHG